MYHADFSEFLLAEIKREDFKSEGSILFEEAALEKMRKIFFALLFIFLSQTVLAQTNLTVKYNFPFVLFIKSKIN